MDLGLIILVLILLAFSITNLVLVERMKMSNNQNPDQPPDQNSDQNSDQQSFLTIGEVVAGISLVCLVLLPPFAN